MKLFICGWRPWTVMGRYRSLMVNAQRLGHDVLGIASTHMDCHDMTMSAFEQIGVNAVMGKRSEKHVMRILDGFQPDAVFGEQYWNCPEEVYARRWARDNEKQHFVLDHHKNYGMVCDVVMGHHKKLGPESTLLTAVERVHKLTEGQVKAKVALVGMPNYDLVQDWDIGLIRDRLGVGDGQKLALVSMTLDMSEGVMPGEGEKLQELIGLAQQRDWRLVCSPHPTVRVGANKFRRPAVGRHLRSLQDQGVLIVSDFVPGVADGVVFEQCPLFELLAACDGAVGSSYSIDLPAYVMGKEYFSLGADRHWLYAPPNASVVKPGFSEFIDAVERGSSWEQDEETIRRCFYKLDGLVWNRILDLVEERK